VKGGADVSTNVRRLSLPRVDNRVHHAVQCAARRAFIPLLAVVFTVSQFFKPRGAREENADGMDVEQEDEEGSRASAFIAGNGIKARWKRASAVFRGLDGRDKENGCRSSRANPPLDPPSTK